MKKIGIDLGTTNTVAAIDGQIREIGDGGSNLLPSVVAFMPNGTTQVGALARRRRSIDGKNTIFSSKRIIGRSWDHSLTRGFIERYPFDMVSTVDAGDQMPAFNTRGGVHSPTDIAALILGSVHSKLKPMLGHDPADTEAVITVPTAFRDPQRAATLAAAQQAGFNRVRLVDEPSATAWAYRDDPSMNGIVAVYDLGGGTFDVSILDCSSETPQLLADASEPFLGGDDIDHQIADWVTKEILKQHNWDLTNYAEVVVRLLAECERAKIRLSTESETRIELAEVDPECPAAAEGLVLRREVMNGLVSQLVQKTFVSCDEIMRAANVRRGDLRAVLLAGGSAHLPVIRDGVEAYFGRAASVDVEPTEVVARGASLSS